MSRRLLKIARLTVAGSALVAAGCKLPETKFALPGLSRQKDVVAAAPQPEPPPARKVQDPAALHLAYAQWREQLGDAAGARESYKIAIDDNPRSRDALLGLARLDLLAGRHQESLQRLERARDLYPGDPHVAGSFAAYHASQNDWPRAAELYRAAIAADSPGSAYHYQLGIALARSGREVEACEHLQHTISPAEAHFNIAHILAEQGRSSEAIGWARQAVRLSPELEPAQTLLARLEGRPVSPAARDTRTASQHRLSVGHKVTWRDSALPGATQPPPRPPQYVVPGAPSYSQHAATQQTGQRGIVHVSGESYAAPQLPQIRPGSTPWSSAAPAAPSLTQAQQEQLRNQQLAREYWRTQQ